MDFWQTILVVFRRWYVAVPAFLGALGIAGLVYAMVPAQYVSNSVLVLTTPPTGGTETADPAHPNGITNPLLNFDQGLSLSASILIQALSTPETAADLGITANGDTSYEVSNGSTNPELLITGPFVFITGSSVTAEGAEDVVHRVSDRARQDLTKRQDALDAPLSTFISVDEVVAPTTAVAPKGGRLRAAGAAGVLAAFAGLAAAFGFESVAVERRRRRSARHEAAPPPSNIGRKSSSRTLSLRR